MKRTDAMRLLQLLEQYWKENRSEEAETLITSIRRSLSEAGRAGRKPKYSGEMIRTIHVLRENGTSIRSIAKITGCSIGYVQQHVKDDATWRKE